MEEKIIKRILELEGYTVGEITDIINKEFNTHYDSWDVVNRIQAYYEEECKVSYVTNNYNADELIRLSDTSEEIVIPYRIMKDKVRNKEILFSDSFIRKMIKIDFKMEMREND